MNLPPRFRGRVRALDNGGCWLGKGNGGRRRKRVFHRVLRLRFWHCLDIGFYEVTEPDEKERERKRAGKG